MKLNNINLSMKKYQNIKIKYNFNDIFKGACQDNTNYKCLTNTIPNCF